jgi:hypothetical protein
MELVVVNLTVFHRPLTRRWILTGTLAAQAANASPTLTFPRAIRCFRSVNVMLLEWVVTTVTVKFVALVAVPLGVVTVIGPVVAPVGTFVTICVAVFDVIVAITPPNFTQVAPVRSVPLIVTEVPTGPLDGENELMVGSPLASAEGTARRPTRSPARARHAKTRRGSRPAFISMLPTRAGTRPIVAFGRYVLAIGAASPI